MFSILKRFFCRKPDRDAMAAQIAAAIVVGGCTHGLMLMDNDEIARQAHELVDALLRERAKCE